MIYALGKPEATVGCIKIYRSIFTWSFSRDGEDVILLPSVVDKCHLAPYEINA